MIPRLDEFTYDELRTLLGCITRVELMQDNGYCSGHNHEHMEQWRVQIMYAMSEVKQRENITNN
jgi:hypothetical protein